MSSNCFKAIVITLKQCYVIKCFLIDERRRNSKYMTHRYIVVAFQRHQAHLHCFPSHPLDFPTPKVWKSHKRKSKSASSVRNSQNTMHRWWLFKFDEKKKLVFRYFDDLSLKANEKWQGHQRKGYLKLDDFTRRFNNFNYKLVNYRQLLQEVLRHCAQYKKQAEPFVGLLKKTNEVT